MVEMDLDLRRAGSAPGRSTTHLHYHTPFTPSSSSLVKSLFKCSVLDGKKELFV